MESKKFFLIVLLLIILSIGAVNAVDTMQDEEVPLDEPYSVEESVGNVNEDILNDSGEGDNSIRLLNDEVAQGNTVDLSVDYNQCSIIDVRIDGVKKNCIYDYEEEDKVTCSISTKGLDFGLHNLFVNATNNCSRNFSFYIKNLVVTVPDQIIVNSILDSSLYVQLPSDAEGKIVVSIDDKKTTTTIKKTSSKGIYYDLNDLCVSDKDKIHIIDVKYYNNLNKLVNSTTIAVSAYYKIYIDNETFTYGRLKEKNQRFSFEVPDDFSRDKISVNVDGENVDFEHGRGSYCYIDLGDLGIGNHSVSVFYAGDSKYYPDSVSANVCIIPEIIFYNGDWTYGFESQIVSLKLPDDATGNLEVYDGINLYGGSKIVNGYCEISLSNLKPGLHNLTAKYAGEDYNVEIKSINVNVDLGYYLDDNRVVSGTAFGVGVLVPKNVNASVSILIDDEIFNKKIVGNGEYYRLNFDGISNVGQYTATIIYNENGLSFNKTFHLEVIPKCIISKATSKDSIITIFAPGDSGVISISASSQNDDYFFTANVKNGKSTISIAKLNKGSYYFSFYYKSDKLSCFYDWDYDKIIKHSKLTAKDTSVYYASGSNFKVKVKTAQGKIVRNKYVKFYINGKYVKKIKTNKKGIAALKITKAPNKYKITIKYDKVEITRQLSVKHILSLKTVSIKKSAKSLVLKATLKAGKKALKNKKVSFKFNGKTYSAKTNKKGVAKLTVSKKVLKKLKVGKKISYKATYLKDSVKKSGVVQK